MGDCRHGGPESAGGRRLTPSAGQGGPCGIHLRPSPGPAGGTTTGVPQEEPSTDIPSAGAASRRVVTVPVRGSGEPSRERGAIRTETADILRTSYRWAPGKLCRYASCRRRRISNGNAGRQLCCRSRQRGAGRPAPAPPTAPGEMQLGDSGQTASRGCVSRILLDEASTATRAAGAKAYFALRSFMSRSSFSLRTSADDHNRSCVRGGEVARTIPSVSVTSKRPSGSNLACQPGWWRTWWCLEQTKTRLANSVGPPWVTQTTW